MPPSISIWLAPSRRDHADARTHDTQASPTRAWSSAIPSVPPFRSIRRLADQFAGTCELRWIIGEPPGHAGLAYQGWRHSALLEPPHPAADCVITVRLPAALNQASPRDRGFPLIV